MSQPKPKRNFTLGGYLFGIEEAGPIQEIFLGLYVGDGSLSWYYTWFPQLKTHAVDWALLHNKQSKHNVFSGLLGDPVPFTNYQVQDPIRINQLAPADNRTQIGIALQKQDSFLVRFIISSNNDRNRHSFMIWYRGVAPDYLIGKVSWGRLVAAGDTPGSVPHLFPT